MTTKPDPPEASGGRTCPHCRQDLIQVSAFWICPTHGQVPEPKPFLPLRIFLSYGHDANQELVHWIKSDLEKRGHDIWIDKAEIRFGDDWRRSITEGIVGSHRVLAFLSKHSARDPGVCRDEIAIAIGVKGGNIQTILVESEEQVQPPVNISHIQWLDMQDWRTRRAGETAAWEEWYQAKFAEIVRVVESDESRRFSGEIETLSSHLKPIRSDARICELLRKGFQGRKWLFEAVEAWRAHASQGSRLFWVMGVPGVGKSAFAAQMTHMRGDTVVAAQFCEWDKTDHRDARRVVRSLAFQLATRLPDYRKLLLTLPEIADLDRKDAAELFDYLLATPLHTAIKGGRHRYLIVIDAIDEAAQAATNPLVEMLARHAQRLPEWLGIVVTSRPEYDVRTSLQSLNPFPFDTSSESNRDDIRAYLWNRLASFLANRSDVERLLGKILEKSEGVFLYIERFCQDVESGHVSLDRAEDFPQGLGGTFYQYFQRQFPDVENFRQHVRPALRVILAAREPLPVEILRRLFKWEDEELRDFTRPLGSLLPVMTEYGQEIIRPYHKSLADWLADKEKAGPYFVSVVEGNRMLAQQGWEEYERGVEGMTGYFLRQLIDHLYAAAEYQKILQCCEDGKFFPRQWHYPHVWVSLEDLSNRAKAMVEGFPIGSRKDYAVILSHSFAKTALAFKEKILSFGQPWHETAKQLRDSNVEGSFAEYRDTFYKFLYASTMAAVVAAEADKLHDTDNLYFQQFLDQFRDVQEWHWYLTSASAEVGLSGKLEDEALELYDAWQFQT